jgi:two-component system NtrC family sensor kinase
VLVVKFRKSLDSLAGKLILTIGSLMMLASFVFGLIFYHYEQTVTLENLSSHARFSADLVLRGIGEAMLAARRDTIQETVTAMGALVDIREITIFNSAGEAVYSTDPATIGTGGAVQEDGDPNLASALSGIATKPVVESAPRGEKAVRHYTPIRNLPSCSTAACHAHSPDTPVLGVLRTGFSATSIVNASRQILMGTLFFWGAFVACLSVLLCIVLYYFVSKPVALMEEGMKRFSGGDFDTPIEITSRDEMGLLGTSLNAFSQEMKRYRRRLENWALELQKEVDKKTEEIMSTREQLVNAEKLASLGRLAAGVAHELNSPLTGIITFAHLMRERIPPDQSENREDLDVIIEQADRCSKIIKGLLGFSRKAASEKLPISVNELMESTISMLEHQPKFQDIEMTRDFGAGLPKVTADPNQVQQVILNLITNATDAMNERGSLHMETRTLEEDGTRYVEMLFTDTGPGIIPEHMGRIFEPFFTTKPVGQGTGLGLPVSYGIIKRHGGDILVRSRAGHGTTFTVRLPVEDEPGETTTEEKA